MGSSPTYEILMNFQSIRLQVESEWCSYIDTIQSTFPETNRCCFVLQTFRSLYVISTVNRLGKDGSQEQPMAWRLPSITYLPNYEV